MKTLNYGFMWVIGLLIYLSLIAMRKGLDSYILNGDLLIMSFWTVILLVTYQCREQWLKRK
jgi:hypothetical protein